ncbi:MAG: hypothetical protein ABI793_14370 [Flavobacterium sp.]
MKKRILLAAVLQFFLVLNSCSSDDSKPAEEWTPEGIKADFITLANVEDFVINNDGTVSFIGQTPNDKDYIIKFQKVDNNGNVTLLKGIENYDFLSNKLTVTPAGDILLIAYSHQNDTDKIFRFENNFTELNPFYTMKPISSPYANKIKLTAICNNNDNSYFVYDYNNKEIKRFLSELKTDVFVAGSGKEEIVDGSGLDVSFGGVTKIISLNNVLYMIDNLYDSSTATYKKSAIRKLEYVNNQWKVTTLISAANEQHYTDLAFDSKNDLYVSVWDKGIYKLNLIDNTLSLFIDKEEVKVWRQSVKDNVKSVVQDYIDFKHIDGFKFKNNDLYISNSYLIKISDFQSKLNK